MINYLTAQHNLNTQFSAKKNACHIFNIITNVLWKFSHCSLISQALPFEFLGTLA